MASLHGNETMEAGESPLVVEADSADIVAGPNTCRICFKAFENRSLLNIHYTHTHRDKPLYECNFCGMVFNIKRELATHRRIHNGEPLHLCTYCGKAFGTKQLLKKHHVWHTGQRDYVCHRCGKAFYQKGHLTQHMMIHTGGRPHLCELCGKTFIFKFDLNRHLKIHAERNEDASFCPDDPVPVVNEEGCSLVHAPTMVPPTMVSGIIQASADEPLADELGSGSNAIPVENMEQNPEEELDTQADDFVAKWAEMERQKTEQSNVLARQIIMASLKSKCQDSVASKQRGQMRSPACTASTSAQAPHLDHLHDGSHCSCCSAAQAELEAAKAEIRALRVTMAKQRTRLTIREKELRNTRSTVGKVHNLATNLLHSCAEFDAALVRNQAEACNQLLNLG